MGGGVASGPGINYVDPFDLVCADYESDPDDPYVVTGPSRQTETVQTASNGSYTSMRTTGWYTAEGDFVESIRIIKYYNEEGVLTRLTVETMNSDGHGTRAITDWEEGTSSSIEFEADLDEQGHYKSNETRPPAENPNSDDPAPEDDPAAEEPVEVPPPPGFFGPGSSGDPGPDGDDSSLEDFCERRGTPSGVEQAAATDPTVFAVGCGDLVGAPVGGDDCTIFEWARAGDFRGATEGGGSNCGPLEKPDEDGNCMPSVSFEDMRGRTAEIASISLLDADLCPIIVCRRDPLAGDAQQEPAVPQSGELPTETPAQEPSSIGTIPDLTLCYWGPGAEWGTVSSLAKGLRVEIVGVGELEGWLIVVNPNYEGVTCWVDIDNVVAPPDLEMSSLPEFETPALSDGGGGDDDGQGDSGNGQGSPGAPASPSGLQVNVTCGGTTYNVSLSWSDNSNNESGFRIYREGNLIGTVGPNTTQFTDNSPPNSAGNNYTVRAYNAAGESSAIGAKDGGCLL